MCVCVCVCCAAGVEGEGGEGGGGENDRGSATTGQEGRPSQQPLRRNEEETEVRGRGLRG